MAEDQKDDPVSILADLESKMNKKTTEPAEVTTPSEEVVLDTEVKLLREFDSFFNKRYDFKNTKLNRLDEKAAAIIQLLTSGKSNTAGHSLLSNIVYAWAEDHRSEIIDTIRKNTEIDI